jgi:hypothetical protein
VATTIKESFRQFAENLNITDRQTATVSNCHKNVVGALSKKLTLHTDQPSKLIGSYDRDTLTRYLKEGDVDLMVVLSYRDNQQYDSKEGVSNVLARFKAILKEAYADTESVIDRNCVSMKLAQFKLDVVPAFKYDTGAYSIPDTYRGQWLETNPVKFAERVTEINKNMGGSFVPLIKMIKGWNRAYAKRLRGFHIECMMINHYKGYTESYTYDSMVKVFFSKLPEYLNDPSYDPTSGDRVDLYLDNDSLGYSRSTIVSRAKTTYEKALEAYEDAAKYPSVSISEWKAIMGEFFPAYG